VRDIRRRFRINMLHLKNVMLYTCTPQAKPLGKITRKPLFYVGEIPFATETS
jgi:hypothetical protein